MNNIITYSLAVYLILYVLAFYMWYKRFEIELNKMEDEYLQHFIDVYTELKTQKDYLVRAKQKNEQKENKLNKRIIKLETAMQYLKHMKEKE